MSVACPSGFSTKRLSSLNLSLGLKVASQRSIAETDCLGLQLSCFKSPDRVIGD